MSSFFKESALLQFRGPGIAVLPGELVNVHVVKIDTYRNEELDLIIELTSDERPIDKSEKNVTGTIRRATEVIEFRDRFYNNWTSTARGVISRGYRTLHQAGQPERTVQRFTAHSIEWDFKRENDAAYVIEWLDNIPDHFIWGDRVKTDSVENYTRILGSGPAQITMTGSTSGGGGQNALHVRAGDFDLYLLMTDDDEKKSGKGQIIYKGHPDQNFRDKVRNCLSFALGKPIVYLGHTVYDKEWQPTFMKSVDAFSVGGAAFKLHDLPPYPINEKRYENVIDKNAVSTIVNSLLAKYDAVKFNELSWSYWYAVCAPMHVSAVHFGSLIEQLQRNAGALISSNRGQLLEDVAWRSLKSVIMSWLRTADLDENVSKILSSKTSSLNQAPQNLILKRLMETMGLQIGEAETNAWRHRNMAAHGGQSNDHAQTILNARLLKILFHRMIAGITYCSDSYIDYYSLKFPVRNITEAVPLRT